MSKTFALRFQQPILNISTVGHALKWKFKNSCWLVEPQAKRWHYSLEDEKVGSDKEEADEDDSEMESRNQEDYETGPSRAT
ncbi:hypothetical protein ACH5RR_023134 [Cinchona calisaya]|uniref:Uncharacterized protein n=1 Tax=Cinchona calisaya TaxID=153742 RepID=A0ABD2ZCZ1_9GENT